MEWLHDTNAGVWLTPILVGVAVLLSRVFLKFWVWMLWIFGGSLVLIALKVVLQ